MIYMGEISIYWVNLASYRGTLIVKDNNNGKEKQLGVFIGMLHLFLRKCVDALVSRWSDRWLGRDV
jgi:hypothetical protein